MVNVVLDTNLIIAAYYNRRSASAKILDLARNGKINVLWSEKVFEEAKFILDKIKAGVKFRRSLLSIYKESRKIIKPERGITIISDDPSDNKLIGCAVKGASFIISNDHHLLDIGEFRGVKMVTPQNFLKKLNLYR